MEELREKLYAIHSDLVQFRAEVTERHRHVNQLLDDHHETLYGHGNGSPGLRMKTDRLEHRAERLERRVREVESGPKKLYWLTIGAIVAAIGSIVGSWFQRP